VSETDKSLVNRLSAGLKQPLLWIMLLFGAVMLVVMDLLPNFGDRLMGTHDAPPADADRALTAEIVDHSVLLRWNGLVNSWRHPSRPIRYETELRLSLALRNDTGRDVEIQQLRLLSEAEERLITWEALWQARSFERDMWAPIDPQIQRYREPLSTVTLEDGEPALPLMVDFVPLDHTPELPQGGYTNRLQARLSDRDQWVELTAFDFTIPEDFELSGSHVSRYQVWQTFPLNGPAQEITE
jgi:hypothetical protein